MGRSDPDFLRFYAATLLREAAARRHSPAFHAVLIRGVARARQQLSEARKQAQGDLFNRRPA